MSKYWSVDDQVRHADTADKPGKIQEITENIHKILDWNLDGDEENALIITDTDVSPILYHTMAGVLSTFDVEPTIMVIPLMDAPNNEPSDEVAQAATATDLVINMCRYSITHTEAIAHALHELDKKYLLLADPTEDYFRNGAVTADPARVDEFNQKIHSIISDADWVTVGSDAGTDVEMSLEGREPILAEYPLGETPLCPVEESVNGTIVHDSFMMGIGILEEPIEWEVEDGRIVAINGGREAQALRTYVETKGDENSYWIGEFSVQTQPNARPNGNYIEHKQVRGGVHFALGTGTDLGGKYQSCIHLDGIQLEPTVTVDGHELVRNGEFDQSVVSELESVST